MTRPFASSTASPIRRCFAFFLPDAAAQAGGDIVTKILHVLSAARSCIEAEAVKVKVEWARELGRVAARDEGQALTWYKLAAAQGHTAAALQAQSLQGRGVVAKNPVPLERAPAPAATSAAESAAAPPPEPAAEQSAATSEPSAEQQAA